MRQNKLLKNLPITIAILLLLILIAAPIGQLFIRSVYDDGNMNLLAPFQVILNNGLRETYINTLLLGLAVVIGASIVAIPVSFIMVKTGLSKYKWIDIVLLIPFMTPPYIGAMGWITFLQPRGFLFQLFPFTEGVDKVLFSFIGLVIVMSLHIFPFLYLIIKNALLQISGNIEEAAVVHGATTIRRLTKIIAPLLFSSYVMGSLLVFVKTISEFGTPVTLGRRIGFYVLTTEIHHFVSSWPIDFSKATSLASMLLGTCIIFWYFQNNISKKHTYKTVGGKGQKKGSYSFNMLTKIGSWIYMIIILLLSIGVPYFSIIATSLLKLRGYGLQKGNFTFEHYKTIFQVGSQSYNAFFNSLKIALTTATICAILGTFFAILIMSNKGWRNKIVDSLSLMPNTVPGIVLVIGLILFWNAPWMKIPIYNTYWMVIVTYVVFFIPFTVQYVKSCFGQIDRSLLNAGRVCGGNNFYNYRRILIPLIMPGIAAGWMMTFTIAFRELVAALMILPPTMETTSTYIFSQFEQGEASLGMAMAVVSVTITLTILLVFNRFFDSVRRG